MFDIILYVCGLHQVVLSGLECMHAIVQNNAVTGVCVFSITLMTKKPLYTTRNNSIVLYALRMIGFLIDAVVAAVALIDKYANIIIITYCAR